MKTIYKSAASKSKVIRLYDEQLAKLTVPYTDLYFDTSFGKTHIIETGNINGKALFVFHGGNATTAYNLLACRFCLMTFIYLQLIQSDTPVKVRKFVYLRIIMIMGNGRAK